MYADKALGSRGKGFGLCRTVGASRGLVTPFRPEDALRGGGGVVQYVCCQPTGVAHVERPDAIELELWRILIIGLHDSQVHGPVAAVATPHSIELKVKRTRKQAASINAKSEARGCADLAGRAARHTPQSSVQIVAYLEVLAEITRRRSQPALSQYRSVHSW